MDHPLQCRCGALTGSVAQAAKVNRCVCYCRDCQAFAHFLGDGAAIMDPRGGTEIIQTLPRLVRFTNGVESLACMRLTDRGLLRWYASCCDTPIGNTLASPRLSFVGLVHSCLRAPGASLDASFGPIRMRVNTEGAKGHPKPESVGRLRMMARLLAQIAKARLDGSHRITPFFDAETSEPVVKPRVLTRDEHAALAKRLG